jgi:hypothetical protein
VDYHLPLVTRFSMTILRPWKKPYERLNIYTNNKEKSLPFRRIGMTRRGLRRNIGRRETCLPLS